MPEMDRPGERPWWDFDPVMVSPCGREEAISRSRALQQLSLDVEMGVSLEALPTICAEAQRLTEIEATAAAADAERALGYGQRALMAAEQGDYRAAYEASLDAVALERHYRDVGQVHVWSSVLHLVELLEALRAGAGSTTPTSSVWLYMFFAENEYEGRVFRRLVTLPFVPESGLELKLGEGPLGLTFTLEDLMYDLTDGTFVAVESGPLEDIPLFEENGFVEELQPGKARRPKRWDARE
jgi:hypothetical protein